MDLEAQMVCTTRIKKLIPDVTDVITEILYKWSPQATYRWVKEYSACAPAGKENDLAPLTGYWKTELNRVGLSDLTDCISDKMTSNEWLHAFQDKLMPAIKKHRVM